MDKGELLLRLAGVSVADLPSPEINEIAGAIAKLTEGKAPATMGQKRNFIENWFSDNKADMPAGGGGGGGGGSGGGGRAASAVQHEPEGEVEVRTPSRGGGGGGGRRAGGGLARSPRGAPATPPPEVSVSAAADGPSGPPPLPPSALDSVDAILTAISQFRGGEIPLGAVHAIADAIQRIDNSRQPGALEQKRIYIDDFFRSKTGASIAASPTDVSYGQHAPAHLRPSGPSLALQEIDSGEALLDAVHQRMLSGAGWLSSMDEAIPLARAVHTFTNMPTDGADPQMYVADWYNWVRHTSQPLPLPAVPPHDDASYEIGLGGDEDKEGLRKEIAELNYQVRTLKDAPHAQPAAQPAAAESGKENALWAMITTLTSQVQNLTTQVASSNEKASAQQAQMLQQQMATQAQMAQQTLNAMMAMSVGGSARAPASPAASGGGGNDNNNGGGDADGVEEATRPEPGSRADVELQLIEYLAKFYEAGKDVPLDNLGKVCEHICALNGKEVPKQLAKKRELAHAWYLAHKNAQPPPGRGGGGGGGQQRPQTAPAAPSHDSAGGVRPENLPTPRNAGQLLELLHSVFRGDPDMDLPLPLVPKFSSSIAELSSKNAPKLIKDKREFIKEYYRKQMAQAKLEGRG
ncbi:hypothetical protein KFE25_008536 [Diacronema lutheri]|uniref:Uncharacterized protein n=2 Tax=Diacronema lutheri TaxID=2081491 RepID=A0A8J5XY93_DIALT|nr:hypothetical protein KFE25_008536 [Diacronema lutheri]